MKGTTMNTSQNRHDNVALHLEWETKFAAALVIADLKNSLKNH